MRHRSRIARAGRATALAAAFAAALLAVQQLGAEGVRVGARDGLPTARDAPDSSDGAPATAGARDQAAAHGARSGAELPALEPAASQKAGGADAAGGSPPFDPRIELDPLELEPDSGAARISGFDPLGPRPLVLWRLVDGRSAVMARGASAPGGALRFPRVIVPRAGLEVAVAPEAGGPEAPGASLPRELGPGSPPPPYGQILAAEAGRWSLRVRAGEAGGEILLAGVDGEIFARYALPPPPAQGAPVFELLVELPATDTHVWLAQALPDGRRSEWRLAAPYRLDGPEPSEAPEVP